MPGDDMREEESHSRRNAYDGQDNRILRDENEVQVKYMLSTD